MVGFDVLCSVYSVSSNTRAMICYMPRALETLKECFDQNSLIYSFGKHRRKIFIDTSLLRNGVLFTVSFSM